MLTDISSGYFQTMGMTLVAGRAIADGDGPGAARVAVINETMARRYWPGESPLGKRVALDLETMRCYPDRPPTIDVPAGMREIVGIVRDIRHSSLDAAPVRRRASGCHDHRRRDRRDARRRDGRLLRAGAARHSGRSAVGASD
jgi:hypothetical protein